MELPAYRSIRPNVLQPVFFLLSRSPILKSTMRSLVLEILSTNLVPTRERDKKH